MTIKKAVLLSIFSIFFMGNSASAKNIHVFHKHVKNHSIQSEDACLASAIYWEAGYESQSGKIAVAEVIMNRLHRHFAKTICGVINQRGQFSFKNKKLPKLKLALYNQCHAIALMVLNLPVSEYEIPENVLYFNMKHSHKFMQHKLKLYITIGNQNFYYKKMGRLH